jgi:hypothetical protein
MCPAVTLRAPHKLAMHTVFNNFTSLLVFKNDFLLAARANYTQEFHGSLLPVLTLSINENHECLPLVSKLGMNDAIMCSERSYRNAAN